MSTEARSEGVNGNTAVAVAPVSAPPTGMARLAAQPARPPVPAVPHSPGYDGPSDFPTMWTMAQSLAQASILPRHFHDQPGNVFAVMTQARAANLPVFVALQHMNVIDGRVEESAELVRAMLIRAGYRVKVAQATDRQATIVLTPPDDEPVEVVFTLVEAQQMGLADKRNWKLNPKAMLVARATTRAASWYAPQVTMGLANLSHADLGVDVPDAVAHLREPDADEVAAAAVLERAAASDSVGTVRALGAQARKDGLLDVVVHGQTLQAHLVERLDVLGRAGQAQEAQVTEVDVLPCGCTAVAVLAEGAHQGDCAGGAA